MPDNRVIIAAGPGTTLQYQDPSGNPSASRHVKCNDRVIWSCQAPAGQTVTAFDVLFAQTPFCKGNNCSEDDHGNGNNQAPTITKQVKSNVSGSFKYSVAVVTKDNGNGRLTLYLDDPEIIVDPT